MIELRKLCEKVETIKAEREVIESELREKTYDMTDQFMAVRFFLFVQLFLILITNCKFSNYYS